MRDVGALFVHELGHLRGLHHRDMRGAPKWTWRGVAPKVDEATGETIQPFERHMRAHAWATAFKLRKREAKPALHSAAVTDEQLQRLNDLHAAARKAENDYLTLRRELAAGRFGSGLTAEELLAAAENAKLMENVT